MNSIEEYMTKSAKEAADFSPYESNGGSIIGIAGDDYAVVAADSRLSSGYTIHTRQQSKLFKLTPQTVLASTGCWCDTLALVALLEARLQMYTHKHTKTMSTEAAANMLSILMYGRRFFPYYVSNILAGLNSEGKGIIYSYDPVGHCEASLYRAGGSSGALLQPLLDCQVGYKNMNMDAEKGKEKPKVPKERAMKIAVDAFISAAERDILTGDSVRLSVITKSGIEEHVIPLRKD